LEAVEAVEQTVPEVGESTTTTPPSADEGEGEGIRLKTRIADLERQLGELDGYAQLGVEVAKTPEGRAIIDRWQRGEALFQQQQQPSRGGQTAARAGAEPALTHAQLQAELNQRDAARRQMDDLNELATENLPEFKKISRSPVYAGKLDACLQAVWNGSIPVAEECQGWSDQVRAKNYTAMKESYEWYLKGNEKVVAAAKAAGKAEASERAAAALAGQHTSSEKSTSTTEPPPKTEEDELIERMMSPGGVGKSFATVGNK